MARYIVDSEHSEVFVETRANVHPIEIRTHGLRGTIEVELRAGKIDLSSGPRAELELSADLLRSGIGLYDSEIHRQLEVRKYRTVEGKLIDASEIAPGRFRVRGILTLHGVTRELEGEVTVRIGDDSLEIEGATTLDVREHLLEPPKILMLEAQPLIHLRAKIRAVRERSRDFGA